MTTLFMTGIALSGLIGGLVSGWSMKNLDGVNGCNSWQWLFLLEGILWVVVGIVVFIFMDDRMANAKWLTAEERELLEKNIAKDNVEKVDMPVREVLKSGRVWLMSLIYFSFVMGLYGVSFWLPTIIKATGVKDAWTIGLLSAIPFGAAVIGMLLVARSGNRRGVRPRHT